ncbi:MAG: hypothetical protein GY953_10100, partial [bacterium]|nr:hypothetical protein [bacterium]
MPRWQPWTALTFFAVGLVPVVLLSGSLLHNRIDLEMGPEVFEDRARAIAEELGHTAPPANRAIGLENDLQYFRRLMEAPDLEAQKLLLSAKTSPIRWWYRESPGSLAPDDLASLRPSMIDPGWDVAGMLGVVMDNTGNLVELRRRPADNEAFENYDQVRQPNGLIDLLKIFKQNQTPLEEQVVLEGGFGTG